MRAKNVHTAGPMPKQFVMSLQSVFDPLASSNIFSEHECNLSNSGDWVPPPNFQYFRYLIKTSMGWNLWSCSPTATPLSLYLIVWVFATLPRIEVIHKLKGHLTTTIRLNEVHWTLWGSKLIFYVWFIDGVASQKTQTMTTTNPAYSYILLYCWLQQLRAEDCEMKQTLHPMTKLGIAWQFCR